MRTNVPFEQLKSKSNCNLACSRSSFLGADWMFLSWVLTCWLLSSFYKTAFMNYSSSPLWRYHALLTIFPIFHIKWKHPQRWIYHANLENVRSVIRIRCKLVKILALNLPIFTDKCISKYRNKNRLLTHYHSQSKKKTAIFFPESVCFYWNLFFSFNAASPKWRYSCGWR